MHNFKIFFLATSFALLLFSCSSESEKSPVSKANIPPQETTNEVPTKQKFEIVPSEKVCMVNDRFMGVSQIPIEANGITYYGCCQNCVEKIQQNLNGVRYSKDPVSGEKVDKAKAVIVQNKEDGTVKYFESEASAKGFMEQ